MYADSPQVLQYLMIDKIAEYTRRRWNVLIKLEKSKVLVFKKEVEDYVDA